MDKSTSPARPAPQAASHAPASHAPASHAPAAPPAAAAAHPGRPGLFRSIGQIGTVVVIVAAIAGGAYLYNGRQAKPLVVQQSSTWVEPKAPRVERVGVDALSVPLEVVRSLGIVTSPAKSADQPRPLPPFQGCLAIDTNRLVRVHSPFAGEVVALGTPDAGETNRPTGDKGVRALRLNDQVEEGQLLAVVWSKDFGEKKSELIDALSKHKLETDNLERIKSLSVGLVAQKDVREAETAVRVSENAVAKAEATLRAWRVTEEEIKRITDEASRLGTSEARRELASKPTWARVEVRSPLKGVILEKNTAIGDVIDSTADLFKVADLTRLTAWAQVYEDDLPCLQSVQAPIRWEVRLSNRPGVSFPGTLEQIGAILDTAQHTAPVSGTVENPKGELRAGQFVTVVVNVPPQPGEVEMPTSGLIEDGKVSVVFVQPDAQVSRFVRRNVEVARRFHDVVYIRGDGIKAGEQVVVRGAIQLKQALDDLSDVASAVPPAVALKP